MVGRIGSILGDHDINIASMHVGRRTPGGRAIVVLLLDDDVPPAVLDEVRTAVRADFARIIRLSPDDRPR
jgi:D-3-phosphoglycerate dehydrogenase